MESLQNESLKKGEKKLKTKYELATTKTIYSIIIKTIKWTHSILRVIEQHK